MTVYGGFQPGTYQAWALNLQQSTFGAAGIARGMQVTPTAPAGMSVLVTIDGTHGDGVCYIQNGGWVRIDATLTLAVPSNSSGNTRNDAVVATMDPTGATAASIQYIQNWSGGFAGASANQLVLALVAVPNNATSIASGNITQQTQAASFGSSNTSGNLLPGGQVQTTATSTYFITNINTSGNLEVDVSTQLGTQRGFVIAPVDHSGINHPALILDAAGTGTIPTMTTSANVRLYLANVTTGITFKKYDLLLLLPFA